MIFNTKQLLRHLSEGNIIIETYKKKDFEKFASTIPEPLDNLTNESKGFRISKIHEILFSVTNDFKGQ